MNTNKYNTASGNEPVTTLITANLSCYSIELLLFVPFNFEFLCGLPNSWNKGLVYRKVFIVTG